MAKNKMVGYGEEAVFCPLKNGKFGDNFQLEYYLYVQKMKNKALEDIRKVQEEDREKLRNSLERWERDLRLKNLEDDKEIIEKISEQFR